MSEMKNKQKSKTHTSNKEYELHGIPGLIVGLPVMMVGLLVSQLTFLLTVLVIASPLILFVLAIALVIRVL